MSAVNYYQPHVYLEGRRLTENAPAQGLAAVADLKVKWGSADWFENVDPAALDLTLLDPHGDLLGHATGQRIEIRRDPDDSIVFRGTVDNIKSTYGKTNDPRTGKPRDMWRHRIKALDPLAEMQRDRRRGPTYNSRDFVPYRMHWGPCYMGERKEDISTRSPVPIIWQSTYLDQFDGTTPIVIFPVPAFERSQVVSLLTVLRQTARVSNPMNRPFYFPSEHLIRFIAHPDDYSHGYSNGLNGDGNIILTARTADEEVVLPGSALSIEGGIQAGTALREQVTRVEVGQRMTGSAWMGGGTPEQDYLENTTRSFAKDVFPNETQMTVQVESEFSYGYMNPDREFWMGYDIFVSLDGIYGAPSFEPLQYRFAKHEPAPEWALPWLTPEIPSTTLGEPIVYHLIESLTNWVPGTLPFSILGGQLHYTHKRGWEVTLNQVPRGLVDNGPQTLGDITTAQTIGNVGDQALIADWQRLNKAN